MRIKNCLSLGLALANMGVLSCSQEGTNDILHVNAESGKYVTALVYNFQGMIEIK